VIVVHLTRLLLFSLWRRPPLISPLFPYTTLFRSGLSQILNVNFHQFGKAGNGKIPFIGQTIAPTARLPLGVEFFCHHTGDGVFRSEEHTSELQSRFDLVCRLLLEKKKNKQQQYIN